MLIDFAMAGLLALQGYVATHVLTCLVPAFLLAGAMVTFVNREAVLDYLGERAGKWRSFSLASGSSFLVAACSCTVIPVASGLFYAGAGIGAAFIVLWVAPAANILSLVYTGHVLGPEMVAARVVAALVMAYVVGFVMSFVFAQKGEEAGAVAGSAGPFESTVATAVDVPRARIVSRNHLILIVLVVLSLLMPNYLITEGPFLYKVIVWVAFTIPIVGFAWRSLSGAEIRDWLRETWWFVRTIFPLLLFGVFLVGVIGKVLPEAWVREWLGGNGLRQSFFATLLGSVTYFATMTEAPFVDTMMKLGMGKGPALALLLTGPGLSLPNWLAIAKVFGVRKALVYVPTIIVLGTITGTVYGLVQ